MPILLLKFKLLSAIPELFSETDDNSDSSPEPVKSGNLASVPGGAPGLALKVCNEDASEAPGSASSGIAELL